MKNRLKYLHSPEPEILSLSLFDDIRKDIKLFECVDDSSRKGMSHGDLQIKGDAIHMFGTIDPSNFEELEDPPSVEYFFEVCWCTLAILSICGFCMFLCLYKFINLF